MTNPSKAKGSLFEREVVEFLNANGLPLAERRVTRGAKDAGDVSGVPGWVFELKATKVLNFAGALAEAHVEAANAKAPWYAAIVKRRRQGVAAAYVVMPLEEFTALLVDGRLR